MLSEFVGILFFGIPVGLLMFLVYCWNRYAQAKKENAAQPGAVPEGEVKKWKTILIIVSIVTGVLFTVVIGFVVLLFMAVAFM